MIIFIDNKSTKFGQITLRIKIFIHKRKVVLFSASRCIFATQCSLLRHGTRAAVRASEVDTWTDSELIYDSSQTVSRLQHNHNTGAAILCDTQVSLGQPPTLPRKATCRQPCLYYYYCYELLCQLAAQSKKYIHKIPTVLYCNVM